MFADLVKKIGRQRKREGERERKTNFFDPIKIKISGFEK
jgi:hypothetical protein